MRRSLVLFTDGTLMRLRTKHIHVEGCRPSSVQGCYLWLPGHLNVPTALVWLGTKGSEAGRRRLCQILVTNGHTRSLGTTWYAMCLALGTDG
jgi:hypothetical protein